MTPLAADQEGAESRRSPVVLGLAAGLLLLHATLAWWLRVPGLTTGQDDAVYLLLGRALRQFSYTDLWLVARPIESLYPPCYPAMLALAGRLPGDPVTVAVGLNVLCSTAALGVLFAMIRGWPGALALLVVGAAAVNPALLGSAGTVASEPLYMLLSFLALHTLTRSGASRRGQLLAGILAIAAALTRSIGVVLLLSLCLLWLLERRWQAVAWLLLAGALTVGTWLTWTALAPRQLAGQSYIGDALRAEQSPATPEVAPTQPAPDSVAVPPSMPDSARAVAPPSHPTMLQALTSRLRGNLPGYGARGIPIALGLPTVPGSSLDNWLWVILLGGFGAIGAWVLIRARPATGIYLAGYAALLLLWPYRLPRFLVPVLPLLMMLFLLGAWRLLARRSRTGALLLPALFAGVLLLAGATRDVARWRALRGCDRGAPYASSACYGARQLGFFRAVTELQRKVPADAILLTPKSATVYYLTGHRTVNELEAATLDAAGLDRFLRDQRVEFVLLSRIHFDQWAIAGTLRGLCRSLWLVGDPGSQALLLRIGPPGAATGEACAAIDRFVTEPWRE